MGDSIEVQLPGDGGDWAEAEVVEVLGGHEYSIRIFLEEEDGEEMEEDEEDEAAAPAPALAAAAAPVAAPPAEAAAAAAAAGGAEEGAPDPEQHAMRARVRLLSDDTLECLNPDGSGGGDPDFRCHWLPAATSAEELGARAYQRLAQQVCVPSGTVLPSASQYGERFSQVLRQVVTSATQRAAAEGTKEVSADMVVASIAEVAAALGLPTPAQLRARAAPPPPPGQP